MTFNLPTRNGRAKKPIPAVSIGARRRGKNKKLTPYVMFTATAAKALFGSDLGAILSLEVGTDDHEGWIRLTSKGEDGNVSLRRQSKVTEDLVVESAFIPHDGKTQLRRTEAYIEVKPDGSLLVRLPWFKKKKTKEASL